jgi:hypothetical protein
LRLVTRQPDIKLGKTMISYSRKDLCLDCIGTNITNYQLYHNAKKNCCFIFSILLDLSSSLFAAEIKTIGVSFNA